MYMYGPVKLVEGKRVSAEPTKSKSRKQMQKTVKFLDQECGVKLNRRKPSHAMSETELSQAADGRAPLICMSLIIQLLLTIDGMLV